MIWLTLHAASTWALVGLIWVVQLVHYPLFSQIDPERFHDYHALHMRRITWVVGPLILAEGFTAALLIWQGFHPPLFLGSLPFLLFNWLCTFFVQVPLHEKLSRSFDLPTIHRLVHTNWWRTGAWSIRGVCILFLL